MGISTCVHGTPITSPKRRVLRVRLDVQHVLVLVARKGGQVARPDAGERVHRG